MYMDHDLKLGCRFMKRILCLICVVHISFSMESPIRINQKPTVGASLESDYVKKALDMGQTELFKEILEKGSPVTYEQIEALAVIGSNQTETNKLLYFWRTFGVDFLLKFVLAQNEVPSLQTLAAKKAGEHKNSAILVNRLPQELRCVVIARNQTLIQNKFENLFDIISKNKPYAEDPKISQMKFKLALDLWDAVLEYDTIAYAIRVLGALRKSFNESGKKEPIIINEMIDKLVTKICKNLLVVTNHLRSKNLLAPLIIRITQGFDAFINMVINDAIAKTLSKEKSLLINLLSSTEISCPSFVKMALQETWRGEREMTTVKILRQTFFS